MNESLTIRLDQKLANTLRAAAQETGLPKSDIVRRALELWLLAGENPPVTSRHFGSVRGPVDLSTNKSYRKKWDQKIAPQKRG